ncbi:hypothetical protein ABPH35_10475 [Streptococcus sp. ZJ93]|uniref:hypothetical protein n=1 Tax=Streptococcus handemini TaxID=3161188 RepID=UPI0032EF7028
MNIIIRPENIDILQNKLLLPSLIHMIMLKHSSITQSPLYQEPIVKDDSISIRFVTERELSSEQEEEVRTKISNLLHYFFIMSGEKVEVKWEN